MRNLSNKRQQKLQENISLLSQIFCKFLSLEGLFFPWQLQKYNKKNNFFKQSLGNVCELLREKQENMRRKGIKKHRHHINIVFDFQDVTTEMINQHLRPLDPNIKYLQIAVQNNRWNKIIDSFIPLEIKKILINKNPNEEFTCPFFEDKLQSELVKIYF